MNLIYCALRVARYGEGDTRSPMRASIAGNLVNIALDAILILGLDWGVKGAAVATICGTAAELSVLIYASRARLREVAISRRALRDTWSQGAPNGVQFVMEVGSFFLLTVIVARMSAADGAAHQMVLHLVNVSFLPAHALAEAASVLVGQAVGANDDAQVSRIAKSALMIGAAYSTLCMIVYAILGGTIATALSAGDAALATTATTLIHVGLAFLVTDALNVIARGVLRGASDVRYAAVVGIVTAWVFTPPLAWFLGVRLGYGAAGGWVGLAAEILVGAAILWWRVGRGGWRPAAAKARRAMAGTAV
jgi:MATE family multidrug resistance protein